MLRRLWHRMVCKERRLRFPTDAILPQMRGETFPVYCPRCGAAWWMTGEQISAMAIAKAEEDWPVLRLGPGGNYCQDVWARSL